MKVFPAFYREAVKFESLGCTMINDLLWVKAKPFARRDPLSSFSMNKDLRLRKKSARGHFYVAVKGTY
jgi:hypothetical protein